MLHLTYSNRFEELADALVDDLGAAAAGAVDDLFCPREIVVPNRHVAAWVELAVARRNGVAANLSFPFLESFLAARAAAARPDLRALDRPQLLALLVGLLSDPALCAEPVMAPVRSYLEAGASALLVPDRHGAAAEPKDLDLRRYQLAEQVATLFIEYAVARPELCARWPSAPALGDTPWAATEAWQRRLFGAVFGEDGALAALAARGGPRFATLPALLEMVDPAAMALPPSVHVIGFSYLAPLYARVLSRLAAACELHVYALNPCAEFWEDLGGRRRGVERAHDTPALELWGRPGREHVRALNELSGFDFRDRFVDPIAPDAARAPALAALGRDILRRAPAPGPSAPRATFDDSVRVLACASERRELEVIGGEIWRLVRADPSLRFNQIAVLLCPEGAARYQALLPAVFRELHELPFHMTDVALTTESRVIEAFELLLALPLGRFTRPEMLGLLTHPALLSRFPDVDPADWIRWSDRLGIVHGADRADHADTYIEEDLFNWDQGLRRLALGALMVGERSGAPGAVDLGAGARCVPEELSADELPSAARFALLARSLIGDARYLRQARLPLARWRRLFDLYAQSYLFSTDDAGRRSLERCRAAIAALADADLDGRRVGYRIAAELLRQQLSVLRGATGELYADGVTVAPLAPMRPIPYRVIFVAGLGEGQFPSPERDSPLDLRLAAPRPGDVGPRERDRYTFLETILAARERLYLSHVARDEQTGEALEPSSVVLELRGLLAGYLDEDALAAVTVTHPLRRYAPGYFSELSGATAAPIALVSSPAARREAQAAALRRDLDAHLAARELPLPGYAPLRAALDREPALAALRARLGLPDLPDEVAAGERYADGLSLSLATVRKFLESPAQAWAAAVLRLREEDTDDPIARRDEPFATGPLGRAVLLREVFTAHLAGDAADLDALLSLYERRAELLALAGAAPHGVFSAVERRRHRDILGGWRRGLEALGGLERGWVTYGFGRAREHGLVESLTAPITLSVPLPDGAGGLRPVRVDLVGRTEPVDGADGPGGDGLGSLVLVAGDKPWPKYRLRAHLDQLALAAAGIAPDRAHAATVLTAGGDAARRVLAPWSRDEARAHLAALVGELLGQTHAYRLPCEAVFALRDRPALSVAAALGRCGEFTSDRYGPLTGLDRLAPPADGMTLIERRFGPLLDRERDA